MAETLNSTSEARWQDVLDDRYHGTTEYAFLTPYQPRQPSPTAGPSDSDHLASTPTPIRELDPLGRIDAGIMRPP